MESSPDQTQGSVTPPSPPPPLLPYGRFYYTPNDQNRETNGPVATPPLPRVRLSHPPNAAASSSSCAIPGASRPVPAFLLDNNATEINSERNNGAVLAYFDTFPPGYRFRPLDHELILYYLFKKVHSLALPRNKIVEVNLYEHNPETLAERFRRYGEKEWYFFTPRNKKYRNGRRPNRAAGDGYWKPTGADKEVRHLGEAVGYRRALVFYLGRHPRGDKTNWIMHEYRVKDSPSPTRRDSSNAMMLDEWVLCKIYKKAGKASVRTQPVEEQASSIMHDDDDDGAADQMASNDADAALPYLSFDNYMQQQQFPFADHLPRPDNFSMLNVDEPQPSPSGISAEPGSSSSQAKLEIFDSPYHADPMAQPVYAPPLYQHPNNEASPPLDSIFSDDDWTINFDDDAASWIDLDFQDNTESYSADDIKNIAPLPNPPNHRPS